MGQYVELGQISVWYEESGSGEPLLVLHPGGVDARAFGPCMPSWESVFHVYAPDRRGHGRTADVSGPLTFADMADDTVSFIERVIGEPCRVLGYSDGAIVALLAATRRPELLTRLVAISGPAHVDGWYPGVLDPNGDAPQFMYDMYAEVSPDGRDHYPTVLAKMREAHTTEPTLSSSDLSSITCRTLVMLGDDDEVRLEHAIETYRAIPHAELAVIPGTSHGLLVEKTDLCNQIIVDFLNTQPIETLAPIRRRS